MFTVYLDQNKWIDLARAATGHPHAEPFQDTLRQLREIVSEGRATFVLSCAHYFETARAGDPQRRTDVATVMLELSGSATIAPPQVIVPWELERALAQVRGLEPSFGDLEIFGKGAAHAFNSPRLAYRAPAEIDGMPLSAQVHAQLSALAWPKYELALLADAGPPGFPGLPRVQIEQHKQLTDTKFVDGQNMVRDHLDTRGRQHLRTAMLGTAVADVMSPLIAAAERLGVDLDAMLGNRAQLEELIARTPSRWVEMELRRLRQANPQKAWEGNDLNDLTALSIAIPYCDIVVTERMWTGLINQAKVGDRFGTSVIRDVIELPELLQVG